LDGGFQYRNRVNKNSELERVRDFRRGGPGSWNGRSGRRSP